MQKNLIFYLNKVQMQLKKKKSPYLISNEDSGNQKQWFLPQSHLVFY